MTSPAPDTVILPTVPPMGVAQVLERQDCVFWVAKDLYSVFMSVNQNFDDQVAMTKEELTGHLDWRAEHVAHVSGRCSGCSCSRGTRWFSTAGVADRGSNSCGLSARAALAASFTSCGYARARFVPRGTRLRSR